MKIIIAGSRDLVPSQGEISMAVATLCPLSKVTDILCGLAKGPDLEGREWARIMKINVMEYPAQWETEGRAAGLLRNCLMGQHADGLVAFWDGKSKGTKHMIDYMHAIRKPYVVVCRP